MSIHQQVACPRCHATREIKASDWGKRVTCPDCLEEFVAERSAPESERMSHRDSQYVDDSDIAPLASSASPDADLLSLDESGGDERTEKEFPWGTSSPGGKAAGGPEVAGDGSSPIRHAAVPARSAGSESRGPNSESESFDFTAACPLCGTRQDTTSEQIGQRLQCPDCHLVFLVQRPPRSARRPHGTLARPGSEELRLRDTFARSPYEKLAGDLLESAASEAVREESRRPSGLTPRDAVRQTLRAAEEELRQQERDLPRLPARPLSTNVLGFLSHPSAIVRWLMLSAALYVELGAIQFSVAAAQGGGIQQVLGIFARVFACILGALGSGYLSTSLLSITQESSHGRDAIEEWPGVNVVDWFFDGWPALASLFLAVGPGVAMGQMAYSATGDADQFWWIAVAWGALSLTFAFPVLVLSFMENSSPYSRPVWGSIRTSTQLWVGCWLRCGALVVMGIVLGGIRWRSASSVRNFLLAAGFVMLAMLYFRLLGRLSWACQQSVTAEPDDSHGPEGDHAT